MFTHTHTQSVWVVVELQRPLQQGGCDSANQWPLAFIFHIHHDYVSSSLFVALSSECSCKKTTKVCHSVSHTTSQLPDWLGVTWSLPTPSTHTQSVTSDSVHQWAGATIVLLKLSKYWRLWEFVLGPPPTRPRLPNPLRVDPCYDLLPSVSLLVSGANAGSTNEVAGKSLNQPITMLERSRSSNRI